MVYKLNISTKRIKFFLKKLRQGYTFNTLSKQKYIAHAFAVQFSTRPFFIGMSKKTIKNIDKKSGELIRELNPDLNRCEFF